MEHLRASGVSVWLDAIAGTPERALRDWIARGVVTGIGPSPPRAPLRAARRLRAAHARSGGDDGLVHVAEPSRARNAVVALPLTDAGLVALEQLVAAGRNAAIGPVLSIADARAAAERHLRGLERRLEAGGALAGVVSIAWCPVGAIDAHARPALAAAPELRGWVGAALGQLAYAETYRVFAGARWERLRRDGALRQRSAFRPACTAAAAPLSRVALPGAVVAMPPTAIARLHDVAPSPEPDETEAAWILAEARRAGVPVGR